MADSIRRVLFGWLNFRLLRDKLLYSVLLIFQIFCLRYWYFYTVSFIGRSKEYRSTAGWILLIAKDHIVTMKCRTAIQSLFLYLNCLGVMLNSLSCSFTSISFLAKSFCINCLMLYTRLNTAHPTVPWPFNLTYKDIG